MPEQVELVLDAQAELGEAAIWHAPKQVLYWVDSLACQVHIFDPADRQDRSIDVGQYVGTVVPRASGGVLLAVRHGIASLDPETERLHMFHDPEAHLPGNRFNDGKCDPAGRFWAGTMPLDLTVSGAGSLYCMAADHRVQRMLTDVSVSNGLAWSLDHATMYYVDSPTGQVSAFDFDAESGTIANRRVALTIPRADGYPDGITLDAEGMLWIAHWLGGQVSRWDPIHGQRLDTVRVPATLVTSCAFGGPDLDRLYITTARTGLDEATLSGQPHAGGLFVVTPGVNGLEAFEYAG